MSCKFFNFYFLCHANSYGNVYDLFPWGLWIPSHLPFLYVTCYGLDCINESCLARFSSRAVQFEICILFIIFTRIAFHIKSVGSIVVLVSPLKSRTEISSSYIIDSVVYDYPVTLFKMLHCKTNRKRSIKVADNK